MGKKVLFVATVVKTHIMEFHIPYLKMFKEAGWETAVAARNDYENPNDCHIPYCDYYFDIPFERNPLKKENVKSYRMLKEIIDRENYDIVHCHTPVGAALTRLAARDARKKSTRVIYTAHGFHFFSGAPLVNWLTYYPVEKYLSKFTDILITINQEDYKRAQHFYAKRVMYVPGVGIDLRKFTNIKSKDICKRKELGFKEDDILLLSVGELIKRKNHEIVIRAIAKLKNTDIYSSLHYVICGTGTLQNELIRISKELGVENHVHFLGYRSDISDICNVCDIFVFMSLQEGLPVALMEAMACGLPAIGTKIRGNTDLIINGENGLFSENNAKDLAVKIQELCTNNDLRIFLGQNAQKSIKKFDLESVKNEMKKVYSAI